MGSETSVCDSPDELLEMLADADVRSILATTAEAPRSVSEIVDRCEIPTATAYRKVRRLCELGLVDEDVRIREQGRNVNEYCLRVGAVHISIVGDGQPAVQFEVPTQSTASSGTDAGGRSGVRASTDGGRILEADEIPDRPNQLGALFEAITGTNELVEEQEPAASESRYLGHGDEPSVSEYLTALVRNDGLSETIAEPEVGGDGS